MFTQKVARFNMDVNTALEKCAAGARAAEAAALAQGQSAEAAFAAARAKYAELDAYWFPE